MRVADPAVLAPVPRRTVKSIDPISDVRTLREAVARSQAAARFNTLLLAALAVTGLVLAGVGSTA